MVPGYPNLTYMGLIHVYEDTQHLIFPIGDFYITINYQSSQFGYFELNRLNMYILMNFFAGKSSRQV